MTKSTGVYFRRGATLAERIEYFSIPEPNSGCLLWMGTISASGYARTGKNQSVARLVLNTPPGMMALHKCDNPNCINIDHLYNGTAADNMRDVFTRDRITKPRGNRKLTKEQVKAIRESTVIPRRQAEELGVSRSLVAKIRSGKLQASRHAHKTGFG